MSASIASLHLSRYRMQRAKAVQDAHRKGYCALNCELLADQVMRRTAKGQRFDVALAEVVKPRHYRMFSHTPEIA